MKRLSLAPERRTPAGSASRTQPARRFGFTLLELLVTSSIIFTMAAISMPVLSSMGRSIRVSMAAGRVQAALQQNALLARQLVRPDFDVFQPRVVDAHFFGTAVVFDESAHKAWYTINAQDSLDLTRAGTAGQYIESQTDPAETQPASAPFVCKKAYLRLKGDAVEHMDLPESLAYYGIAVDLANDTMTLYPPPFAVCATARGCGMPQRKYIEVDLAATDAVTGLPLYTRPDGSAKPGYPRGGFDNPTYPLVGGVRRVPACMPWVLVVSRSQSGTTGWNAAWDTAYNPDGSVNWADWAAFKAKIPGANDQERIQNLMTQAHAQLVNVAVNGTAN